MTDRRAATVAAVVLALGLGACGDDRRATTQPTNDAPLGREIGSGASAPRTTGAGGPSARRAAIAFATSYLALSYGQATPDQLRSASPELGDRLRTDSPRVPPGVRKLKPRLVALRLDAAGEGRLRATATVDDGDVAPYTFLATLIRRGGRWIAVGVGS